jgi:DNA topoisomerase-1
MKPVIKTPKPRREGSELFYRDASGKKQDASLHREMLSDVAAQKAICKDAVERAMKRGLSKAHAERLYGWRPGLEGPDDEGGNDEASVKEDELSVNIDEANLAFDEAKAQGKVPTISMQQALDRNMFGPVYHGTAFDIRKIVEEGFDADRSIPTGHRSLYGGGGRPIGSSNGYNFTPYALGIAPPVHHLGFGVYFSKSKAAAQSYNGGSAKNLPMFFIDAPDMEEINFGAPNTMMKWWLKNGYDMTAEATQKLDFQAWVEATRHLTENLRKHGAVYFKGKSEIYKALDGDQICVYDPSHIYMVDPNMSAGFEVGAKVTCKQEIPANYQREGVLLDTVRATDSGSAGKVGWKAVFRAVDFDGKPVEREHMYPLHWIPPANVKGVIISRHDLDPKFNASWGGAKWTFAIKWQKGGTQYNYTENDLIPVKSKSDTANLNMLDIDVWIAHSDHIELAESVSFVETEHPRDGNGEFKKKGSADSVKKSSENSQSKLVAAEKGEDGKYKLPEHIAKLKLPPAWTDLKFNPDPHAALLAIGKDAKGRAQYVYSDEHVSQQAMAKFSRIQQLDRDFDAISAKNDANCKSEDAKTRAHAQCLDLIMKTGLRPGSETDTGAEKQAYGATTLQGKHVVKDEDGSVRLVFTGKKGVDLDIKVTDEALAHYLTQKAKEVGTEGKLFDGVSDASLRDYSHELGGKGYKVKDFRTLRGTRAAYAFAATLEPPKTVKDYKRFVLAVGDHVCKLLGNTRTVCLQAYVSPMVFTEHKERVGA